MKLTRFTIKPRAPFRLDLTVWALRRWPNNRIDRWEGERYRRIVLAGGKPLAVSVVQTAPATAPELQITLSSEAPQDVLPAVTQLLQRILSTHTDLSKFYAFAATDAQLGPLARRFQGLKPPRFPTLFECLLNAIACQQVTLALGIRLLNQLAETHGPRLDMQGETLFALPETQTLAGLPIEAYRSLQFSRQKARAIRELSAAVAGETLDLVALEELDEVTIRARLRQLWGVGRWTAEYALLRGLGYTHIFPGDDVGARNGLARWLDLAEDLDYEGVRLAVARWRPYAGLVYFHLLLRRLAAQHRILGATK